MATLAPPLHKLGASEPAGFDKQADIVLQLQYRIADNGDYLWSYKSVSTPNENSMFLGASLAEAEWSPFIPQNVFETSLDIGLKGRDTLVEVEAVGPDLFWSLQTDAIMTDHDRSAVYGGLDYWNGTEWLPRQGYDRPTCSRIRFKAKALGGPPQRHKFSYFVSLLDRDGIRVEHEIDPDIQNPKV